MKTDNVRVYGHVRDYPNLPYARGQKFYSSAHNYKWNLERMSNSSQSTGPVGRVLWEELLEGEKSEGETSIFWVLTVKSCCQ